MCSLQGCQVRGQLRIHLQQVGDRLAEEGFGRGGQRTLQSMADVGGTETHLIGLSHSLALVELGLGQLALTIQVHLICAGRVGET